MSRRSFGTVRRLPSGRWQARYRERDGRQVSAPATFATKGDATAWLARAQTDQARGELVDPRAGRVTLAEYAELFMGGRVLADRTVETYRGLLELHILPSLGTIEIGQLEPAKIRWWHAKLSREHSSTAAKAYRLLRTILNTAVKDELIPRNPCRIEGAGKEQVGERPIATVTEVEALVEGMPPRFRVVVLLAAWCQLRKAEICGLRRRDLDVVRGTVAVRETLQQLRNGQLLLKGPKSDAGRRIVAIPPHVLPALVRHLQEFTGAEPDALVVTGEHGGLLRPHVLQKHWDRARRAVGRPDLHLHDLRHTGNTWAASTGASIRELMRRMGHSTPAAALRYQHATEQRDRAIADALAAMARPAPVIEIGSAREADPA